MKEFVGVKPAIELLAFPSLKREALTFNRIAIQRLARLLEFASKNTEFRQLVAEIESLIKLGIVFEPQPIANSRVNSNEHYASTFALERAFFEATEQTMPDASVVLTERELRFTDAVMKGDELTKKILLALSNGITTEVLQTRRFSIALRLINGLDAFTVSAFDADILAQATESKKHVMDVILKALPMPDESISWEQIIEYRSDPDSQSKFLALRHWMSEVARAELTPADVEEKIEYLIDQYQKHMKLHKMKTNVGTLETIVTTSAEVLGDLVSFKWGKAAEALFSLRRRQVALLEGELTAPGNEVAYIVKTRETFQR